MHTLAIANTPSLTDLDEMPGLPGLHSLIIDNAPALTSLAGVRNIADAGTLDTQLLVRGTAVTDLTGLEELTELTGDVTIEGNSSLTSLKGLHNLTIVEDFNIEHNNTLTNLNGLGPMTSGRLRVRENPVLTDIAAAFDLPSTVGGIAFYDNVSLASCRVDELETHLQGLGWTGSMTNSGNDVTQTCP